MNFNKFLLFYHTIKHLKFIQIRYQVRYRIHKFLSKLYNFKTQIFIKGNENNLLFQPWIDKQETFNNYRFTFLNITHNYLSIEATNAREKKYLINWDERKYGALWTYNLNYMDYLLQPSMDQNTAEKLIQQYIEDFQLTKTGKESYVIALRGINWIKCISKFQFQNHNINTSLFAQYQILFDNPEYHLLGNHLLEDGLSLLFGAFYFSNKNLFRKAIKIIKAELNEEILEDGGHFELSPMYHQIILDRLLDAINLVKNNTIFEEQDSLLNFMKPKAVSMLQWLNNMTFSDGSIPLLNDSTNRIAPTTEQINQYAASLNLKPETSKTKLSSSGYRRYNGANYECIIDIGQIGPSYQPGHAHADTFNFVLNINNQPCIVDTGISTYEANNIRLDERGTAAHNTVLINYKNSSEIWSSFRVAWRAKVDILTDQENVIIAKHDGYRKLGTTHQRQWNFYKNQIYITDTIIGKIKTGVTYFFLAPQMLPEINGEEVHFQVGKINFENAEKIELIKTKIPTGYNNLNDNFKIKITFNSLLKTLITTK